MLLGTCVASSYALKYGSAAGLRFFVFSPPVSATCEELTGTTTYCRCCHDPRYPNPNNGRSFVFGFPRRFLQAGLDPREGVRGDGDGDAVGEDRDKDSSHSLSGDVASPGSDGATADDRKKAQESQAGFADAVDGLDDIVTGMNAFVDDSSAGLEGAEVEAVGGHVQFDVDKFMSLLNGEDLM